jgi:hypothetical protein
MKDFEQEVEQKRQIYRREIERRNELWHEERQQLEIIHQAESENLRRTLATEDRRLGNRILDFLNPARRAQRHEAPLRAQSTSHEAAMRAFQERVRRDREPLDRNYEEQERELYRRHGQDLAREERNRADKAKELAREHALQERQEKAPAPERSDARGGRGRDRWSAPLVGSARGPAPAQA